MSYEQTVREASYILPKEFTADYRRLGVVKEQAANEIERAKRHNDKGAMQKACDVMEKAEAEVDDLIFNMVQTLLKVDGTSIKRYDGCTILLGRVIQIRTLHIADGEGWKD